MRQDYEKFQAANAEIIALGPDGPNAFKKYWSEEGMPFIGLPDIKSVVANVYHQEVSLMKLGRMPALFVIDKQGVIRFSHYGDDMTDIPRNEEVLKILGEINRE